MFKKLVILLTCLLISSVAYVQINNATTLSPSINLKYLGACGLTDGSTIFNAAATLAGVAGASLYIPGGCTINHPSTLTIQSIKLYGDGITSILNATDTSSTNPHNALYFYGTGVVIEGINFRAASTAPRSTFAYAGAATVSPGQDTTHVKILRNYFTTQFAGPFIQIGFCNTACSNVEVAFNTLIGGSLSNPLISNGPEDHINIHDNYVDGLNVGDTCIENSDLNGSDPGSAVPRIQHLVVTTNIVKNCGAHGISIIGVQHFVVSGNDISNTTGVGIKVFSDPSAHTTGNTDGVIVGNVIAGSGASGLYAMLEINGRTTYLVSDISVQGNTFHMTTGVDGVVLGAGQGAAVTQRITIAGNTFDALAASGAGKAVSVQGATDVSILGNSINSINYQGMANGSTNAGAEIISNNLMIGGAGGDAAFSLQNTGFSRYQLIGNTASGAGWSNLVSCGATGLNLTLLGNSGSPSSVTGCGPTVTSGGGTSPTVTMNGSNSNMFTVTEGSGTPTTTLILAMPTAPTNWVCPAVIDRTSTTITARQSGTASTTAVTITFSAAPAASDFIQLWCNPQ